MKTDMVTTPPWGTPDVTTFHSLLLPFATTVHTTSTFSTFLQPRYILFYFFPLFKLFFFYSVLIVPSVKKCDKVYT